MTPWRGWSGGNSQYWRSGGHGGGARANARAGGYGNGSGSQWWTCSIPGCVASLKTIGHRPQVNKPGAWECSHCELPWSFLHTAKDVELTAAKEALRAVVAKGPDGMTAMLSKAQQKRMDTKVSGDTIVVVAAGSDEWDMDGEDTAEEAAETVLALPSAYTDIAPFLKMPPPLDDKWTPETAVAKFLPKRSNADAAKAQEDLVDLRQLLVVQEKKLVPATAAEVASTKKKIETAEKKVAEADVDSAMALAASEFDVSIKLHARAESARSARFEAAADNADERGDKLEAICLAQMAAWETHLANLRSERSVRNSAWLARRLEVESRATQEEEYLSTRLLEAKARSGDAPPPVNGSTLKVDLSLQDAKAEVLQLQGEKQSLADRLEKLEKAMAAQLAAPQPAAAQLTLEAAAQCHRTVVYTAAELPQLKKQPSGAYKRHLALIHANLQQWEGYGQQPVTYAQLLTGAGDQKATSECFRTLQEVAGDEIWKRFYGDGVVTDGQLVPYQLREILMGSLTAAGVAMKEFAKQANFEESAKACFLKIHEDDIKAKRNRTGPYGQ